MSNQQTTQDAPWLDEDARPTMVTVHRIVIEAGRRRETPGMRVIGADADEDLVSIDVQIEIVMTVNEYFVTDL